MNTTKLLVSSTLLAVAAIGLVTLWLRPDGQLERISQFGQNPTGLEMHLYVPPRLAAQPAVLFALHYCTGSGPDFFAGTGFAREADRHGFIVIYPSVGRPGRCWDVHSSSALSHGGGSDPRGLLSMLDYAVTHHKASRSRVFVTGHSSGGMMTQLLLGAYPDVFSAGAAFAGVPFGCFAGPEEWHADCAEGNVAKSAQEWGDIARAAYPDYRGERPRLQLWHGTHDEALNIRNLAEAVKQWTNVLGLVENPAAVEPGVPSHEWTRTRYVDPDGVVRLEAYLGQGVAHNFPIPAKHVVHFLGLDSTNGL